MATLYANLGSNVDVTAGSASGAGTIGDPYNAKAWYDRVKSGGTGNVVDEYLIQGIANNLDSINKFTKLSPWDLLTFGPWRIKFNNTANDLGETLSTKIVEGVVIDSDGSLLGIATHLYNSMVLCQSQAISSGIVKPEVDGCVMFRHGMNSGGSRTLRAKNSTFRGAMTGGGPNSSVLESNNCAFTEANNMPASFVPFTTVTDSNSQFGYIPVDALPTFLETDKNLFKLDSAVTVNSSGVFTNHLTGLFGNDRAAFETVSGLEAVGSSFFPLTYEVPSIYATITLALAAIPADLLGHGLQDVIIEKGTYDELVVISGFTNPSISDFIKLRAKAGDEHGGIFDTGVIVSPSGGGGIQIFINRTQLLDIQVTSINTSYFLPSASDCILRRCLGKDGTFRFLVNGGNNNKIILCGSSAIGGTGFRNATATLTKFINCVNGGGSAGFHRFSGNPQTINCVSFGSSSSDWLGAMGGSNNLSEDATAVGANSLINQSVASMKFVNVSTDFHISNGSVLQEVGIDKAVDVPTDIDGEAIPLGEYPAGYDYLELVGGGGASIAQQAQGIRMSKGLSLGL